MEINYLKDTYGREIRYVRLSITDRCNFRCSYCAHHLGLTFTPHKYILSYEEMLIVLQALVARGVTKVRLTGGEPFVRLGFMDFLEKVRNTFPTLDIRITTNASMLAPHVQRLKQLNIQCLNISFDSFNEETFRTITQSALFEKTKAGLFACLEAGIPIKLNVVGLKGVNDTELPNFITFAEKHEIDVRYIEYMPLGGRSGWDAKHFWAADDIVTKAQQFAKLLPITQKSKDFKAGPAQMYTLNNGLGRLGVITPVSSHFCYSCNRLRITSEGSFRTCLFSDDEMPFRDLLRSGEGGLEQTMQHLETFIQKKPLGFQLLHNRKKRDAVINRSMTSIGG